MKKLHSFFILLCIPTVVLSQVVMTDKAVPVVDNSAILKLDSDTKGVLYPRIALNSNTDIITIPNPQNGNIVFNTNSTATLPQTVAYYDNLKWNALLTKEQVQEHFDIVNTSSVSSAGNISITGFNPGAINLGGGTTGWTSLGITDSKTFTRAKNSLAFTVEGMAQLDKSSNEYFEYAIGIFVDDILVVVRKYHRNSEDATCSWHKFVLNGVVNNLAIGNHTIKVMARNIASTSNSSTQKIFYGGVAQSSNAGNPICDNMSNFMSKISLSTTVVESLN
ncbi:hypothetical protein NZ698_01990 [Chryseobacterium sp. PBS4-4]|uniref:LamG domain-containing protein n=1 Tax=Chryseobacterium edaphi TaxID=2976532 RepID=A0ABT2W137_9FLAO|nr:hypothetical protein [Chryseobacterium edaphi]MCU7615955.1 hypothetical protein [Chryseobacterium edaphi]